MIPSASKRQWRWTAAALVLVALVWGGLHVRADSKDDGPANAATQQIFEETRRILNSIKTTVYQHKTEVDEEKGIYRCDCSGLGGYILTRTVAKDDPKGPLGDGIKRPRAVNFYNAFAKAPTHANGPGRWQRIERVIDARPGDIIAWKRTLPGKHTGHVIMVDQKPVQEEDGLVRMVIIDSTTLVHVDATRPKGVTGVGRGTMWFTVDSEGRPTAYIRGSRTAEPRGEPIAIGRALPQ